MGTSDRESYLRDSWQAYPPIPQGTLSLKKFGQMSPQSCPQSLGLAGKVLAVDPTDSVLMLGAQGEVWKFQLSGDWPLAELGGGARDGRAILAAGDCLWFELGQMKREKGDNRAISGLAKKMVLLAPPWGSNFLE